MSMEKKRAKAWKRWQDTHDILDDEAVLFAGGWDAAMDTRHSVVIRRLRPGDSLIVQSTTPLSMHECRLIRLHFERDLPDVPMVICDSRVSLAVAEKDDLAVAKVDAVTIPRPHVPYGPLGVPEWQADAHYLREAAKHIEGGYSVGGSNLTATVLKLLRDSADALEAQQ